MLGIPKSWIIDSLNTIKDKNDATLAGGFTGAVIEILGRILLYPDDIKDGKVKNKDCFYKFIEDYLKVCNPKYLTYKEVLWKFLRCDGAHNVLAQYGVVFTGDPKGKSNHLSFYKFTELEGNVLIIFLPEFIDDLRWSVEKFFYDSEQDALLKEKHRKVVEMLLAQAQKYIKDNFPHTNPVE